MRYPQAICRRGDGDDDPYSWSETHSPGGYELNGNGVMRYCAGATHRYLCRHYRIKVPLANVIQVKLKGSYFHVYVNSSDEDALRNALKDWLRVRTPLRFQSLFQS